MCGACLHVPLFYSLWIYRLTITGDSQRRFLLYHSNDAVMQINTVVSQRCNKHHLAQSNHQKIQIISSGEELALASPSAPFINTKLCRVVKPFPQRKKNRNAAQHFPELGNTRRKCISHSIDCSHFYPFFPSSKCPKSKPDMMKVGLTPLSGQVLHTEESPRVLSKNGSQR